MAYRAEIEIGVKGAEKLEQIKKKIQSIDQKVEQVNARWKKIRGGIPTKEFGEVNKKLQKTTALQARANALAAATEKRLKGQNSVTRGLLGLNKAVLNAARSEAQARGESVAKQRALNRELAKSQQYSRPIGPKPQRAGKAGGLAGLPPGKLAVAAAGAAAAVAAARGIARLAKESAIAEAELSKLEIALRGVLGSESEEGFKLLDKAARDFNQPILEATKNFTQLSAAAKANGSSVKEIENTYRGLAAATKATGGNAEDLNGVLRATTQVISKGKVRSEELRGQIGDRLPGAFALFAKATKRSAEELQKALEQGEVDAKEFTTTFVNFLRDEFEPAAKMIGDSPAEAGARLQKALEDANRAAGPLLLSLGAKFQQFAVDALEQLNPLLKGINEFFRLDRKGKNERLYELEGGGQRGKGTLELIRSERTRLAGTRRGKTVETANIPGVGRFVGKIEDAFEFLKKQEDRLERTAQQLRNEVFPTGGLDPLKPGPNTTDEDLKGAPRAPRLPTSKGFQLQQQISQELLKQFDIKTKYMQLNMSESEALDFQNTRLRERLQREENLLEFQRQQALATSKYAADAELINEFFNTRLVTLRGQTEAQIQQNSASKEQLAIQEKITKLKKQEELEGLERGLRRDIADVERRTASPFGGDEAERADLLIKQTRRYDDVVNELTASIKQQEELQTSTDKKVSAAATEQIRYLKDKLALNQILLPVLNQVEQAELRQNQLMEKYGFIANEAATAMSSAVQSIVTGTGSVQEAFSDMFANIGKAFIDMATQMIAKALIMKALNILGNAFGGGGGGGIPFGSGPDLGIASGGGFGASFFGLAEGGYVTGPTNALIGEGGEPEYVIPESKMRESMGRYSRGSRGSSVIPAEGGGSAGAEGGTAVAAPIDVRYTVERINSVDYVTADQFQTGMKRAAAEGAQRGQQLTLSRLQQSPATRRRIGM